MSTDNKKHQNPLQHLDAIDLMILRRHYRDAAVSFFIMLDALARDWSSISFSRPDHYGDENYAMLEVCERAARQWLQILSSDMDLTKLDFTLFVSNIGIVHSILMGTSQGTLDDFISALHRKTGGNYKIQDFLRILLAWCPNSRVGFDVFAYYPHAPELVVAHALGCISGIGLVSEESDRHRNKAIDFLIKNRDINIDKFGAICLSTVVLGAWMRCSYADHPDKHKVKYFLNRLVVKSFELDVSKAAQRKALSRLESDDRPLLVVPLEAFSRNHAMYRCYANILIACREHFYTVGMCDSPHYDEETRALFDEFYDVAELSGNDAVGNKNLLVLESVIRSWSPDAVYYPSIGMASWVVALSNTRLAPLQAMTLGHPATSMSPAIDYVLTEDGWYRGNSDLYSETVISLPNGSAVFKLPLVTERVSPILTAPPDGVVRIAIPSISQKLTSGFIRALRRVEQALPDKVQYVFFIGTRSVFYAATVQSLHRQLKNIECHGQLFYQQYIQELNRCHLHAGTFPFGGTNSLIDSLRQGLPIVAMEGREPHALIDGDFVRRAGLPDEFVCHSEDEYVAQLIKLVSEPETLMRWRRYLVNEVDVDRVFLQEGRPERYAEALINLVSGKSG